MTQPARHATTVATLSLEFFWQTKHRLSIWTSELDKNVDHMLLFLQFVDFSRNHLLFLKNQVNLLLARFSGISWGHRTNFRSCGVNVTLSHITVDQ